MESRGLFITVEGGEGVGKTTNMRFLEDCLRAAGVDLVVTREPGGTALGEQIREVMLQPREELVAPEAELLLVFAARAQHLSEVILPALDAGHWVLCDRFTDATYAYQGGGRQLPVPLVRELEQLVQGDLRPDYTILLDAPVAIGLSRAGDRGNLDRIENEQVAFFERVRATYLQLARESSGRYRVVDAAQSLPEVEAQLAKICQELAGCWQARRP
ncbi:dTMP kinase [Haliea sp. E17]|uniref:dTMP kinase n=1 Tax=Haliea sp. E17 TaxID=3401576 RepID=UPI003AAFCBF8